MIESLANRFRTVKEAAQEPWRASGVAGTYEQAELLRMARMAASDKKGRLIDFRIISGDNWTTLQTRVLVKGKIEYHNTAI